MRAHGIRHHTEQFIVRELRKSNVLSISLVAEDDGKIIGHVAVSPVVFSDGSYAKLQMEAYDEGTRLCRENSSSSTESNYTQLKTLFVL